MTFSPRQEMAQVVYRLLTQAQGLSCAQLQKEFGIKDRAFRKFLEELRAIPEFHDSGGETLVEVVGQGEDRRIFLRPLDLGSEDTVGHVISLQFAASMFHFLYGTDIERHLSHLIDSLNRKVNKQLFMNLDRKIYSINEWPKDYSQMSKVLRDCLHSMLHQKTLVIHYKPPHKDRAKTHELNIYTLLQYRNGLYLIGKTEKGDAIIVFALERITKTERTRRKFHYPANYSPGSYIDGAFGLIRSENNQYKVVVNFDKALQEIISARKWHKTAKIKTLKDGTLQLSMTVSALEQVVPWVLSFGSKAKVLKPRELQGRIKEEVNLLVERYKMND